MMKAPANPKPSQPQGDKPQSLNGNLKIGPSPTSLPPPPHHNPISTMTPTLLMRSTATQNKIPLKGKSDQKISYAQMKEREKYKTTSHH